jgi:hypothetical protein
LLINIAAQPDPSIVEIAMVFTGGQGHQFTPPHIVAVLDNNDLLIYRGFTSGIFYYLFGCLFFVYKFLGNIKQEGLNLRFAKVDHGLLTRTAPDEGIFYPSPHSFLFPSERSCVPQIATRDSHLHTSTREFPYPILF